MALEIRQRAALLPGMPPSAIARELGFDVLQLPPGPVRGSTVKGEPVICVCRAGYKPRDEFTAAHELAHHFVPVWLPGEWEEKFCNMVAAGLLLPPRPFLASAREFGFDLAALRRRWQYASWEAIASRLVDVLDGGSAMAAWAGSEMRYRRASMMWEPVGLEDAEREAVVAAYEGRGPRPIKATAFVVRAWRLPARGAAMGRAVSVALAA